jgi:hypothetical protein
VIEPSQIPLPDSTQQSKYTDIYTTSGFRTRILNGILWSKDIRKERKLNICNVLIKSSLLYGAETWRLTENIKKRVKATEMAALRRSSKISIKECNYVNIRQ